MTHYFFFLDFLDLSWVTAGAESGLRLLGFPLSMLAAPWAIAESCCVRPLVLRGAAASERLGVDEDGASAASLVSCNATPLTIVLPSSDVRVHP